MKIFFPGKGELKSVKLNFVKEETKPTVESIKITVSCLHEKLLLFGSYQVLQY